MDFRLLCFVLGFLVSPTLGLDNGLALLPPMGWMSWAAFFCETNCTAHPTSCINEDLYKRQADLLVSGGYAAAGYKGIHIDDCWTEKLRSPEGRLVADRQRFPSGIAALADYMHKKDLHLGIYADVGSLTCAGYPGSEAHEEIDAQTFAEWNVDYIKYDGCNSVPDRWRKLYGVFRDSLNKTSKPIVYGCEWPLYELETNHTTDFEAVASTCNLWRNFHDVGNDFSSVLGIMFYFVENQDEFAKWQKPGAWNDPDMIIAGNNLIATESRTQLSLWAIWSSPLILSVDLGTVSAEIRQIIQNPRMLRINQDPLGRMGKKIMESDGLWVFTKPMTPIFKSNNDTSFAVAFVNPTGGLLKTQRKLAELGLNHQRGYSVIDVWGQSSMKSRIHSVSSTISIKVQPHDTTMLYFVVA